MLSSQGLISGFYIARIGSTHAMMLWPLHYMVPIRLDSSEIRSEQLSDLVVQCRYNACNTHNALVGVSPNDAPMFMLGRQDNQSDTAVDNGSIIRIHCLVIYLVHWVSIYLPYGRTRAMQYWLTVNGHVLVGVAERYEYDHTSVSSRQEKNGHTSATMC